MSECAEGGKPKLDPLVLQIEKVGGRVIGAVLNDVEFNQHGMKKYYYKSYYKYDSSNYGYYGASGDAGRRK